MARASYKKTKNPVVLMDLPTVKPQYGASEFEDLSGRYMDLLEEIPIRGFITPPNDDFVEENPMWQELLKQQEENDMTNQRRVVTVQLIDDDKGLDVENSLVAEYGEVMTEDDNQTTINEIILTKDVMDQIANHNKKRKESVDLGILERTGQTVKLRPIKLKDLRWVVR